MQTTNDQPSCCGWRVKFGTLDGWCAREPGHPGRCLPTRAQAIAEIDRLDRAFDELADLVIAIDIQERTVLGLGPDRWPQHEPLSALTEAFESEWARRRGIHSPER